MNDESIHAPLLIYWNFSLIEDQNFYERRKYKLMDIFGEVGGLMAIVATTIVILLMPWNYKKHEINVLKEFHIQNNLNKHIPPNLSFKLFVHECLPCLSPIVHQGEGDLSSNSNGLQEFVDEINDVIEN